MCILMHLRRLYNTSDKDLCLNMKFLIPHDFFFITDPSGLYDNRGSRVWLTFLLGCTGTPGTPQVKMISVTGASSVCFVNKPTLMEGSLCVFFQ